VTEFRSDVNGIWTTEISPELVERMREILARHDALDLLDMLGLS